MTVNVKKILPLASLVFLLSACDDSVLGGGSSSSVPEDPQQMYELGKEKGIEPKRLRFKINGIEE